MNNLSAKKHHYWRNLLIVLLIAVVALGVWYVQTEQGAPATEPIPMPEYEDMCSEFTQMEGEISCMQAAELAMETTGETVIIDIEKENLRGKDIYTVNFGTVIIEIDANTGEVV